MATTAFVASLRRDTPETTDDEVAEVINDAEQRLAGDERVFDVDQNTLITNFLELATELEDLLMARKWILGVAPESTELVTSDDPVLLIWRGPDLPAPGWQASGQ